MNSAETRRHLSEYLRGISTGHVETTSNAYAVLHRSGKASAQLAKDKLENSEWSTQHLSTNVLIFVGLLGLLESLDRSLFEGAARKLDGSNLNASYKSILDWFLRTPEAVKSFKISGIDVHVSRRIQDVQHVEELMREWVSNIPTNDLSGLLRIDVVPTSADLNYLGYYHLYFSGICMTWPSPENRRLMRAVRTFETERTLYHEVAHHALGHDQFGQDPDQEKQAKEYARKLWNQAHWKLLWTVRLLLFPIFGVLLLRKQIYRRKID